MICYKRFTIGIFFIFIYFSIFLLFIVGVISYEGTSFRYEAIR